MSSASSCDCPCPTPEIVTVAGTAGDSGDPGTDGVSAFTVTAGTAGPFNKGDAVAFTVAATSMFSVGTFIAVEDVNGTNPGFFQISGLTTSQITATYLDISANSDAASIATAKSVSPSGPPYTPGTLPNAITDNSTGTASDTIAAGAGVFTLAFPIQLAAMTTAAADLLTNYVVGFAFKLLSISFVTTTIGAGAGASQILNLEIGTTNVTGGAVTVTLAGTDTLGELTAGTAITAANTGTSADTLSVEVAAGGTVFTAGAGILLVRVQNMDTANAIASLADHTNDLVTALS